MEQLTAIEGALGAWGIVPRGVEPLTGGAVNEHWRIDPAEGSAPGSHGGAAPLVLRRYHPRHAAESTGFEHAVLGFLAARDWPVAPPLPTADGRTVIATEDGRWALFPFLPGAPPPNTPLTLQRKGAVLALLHADLAEWAPPGQRPAFGRVSDLDVYVRQGGFPNFETLIDWYAGRDAERAHALAAAQRRSEGWLLRLRYDDLPDMPVYNECLGANVLFEGDEVTAILDFDFAHLDTRTADISRSLVFDCGADLEQVQRWIIGYTAHAKPQLTPEEIAIIPALMVANEIWNAAVPLAISAGEPAEAVLASVEDSIDHRIPLFETAMPDLRRAVKQGAALRS